MIEIGTPEPGKVTLSGRLDAAQAEKADAVLQSLAGDITIDMSGLEYISSAGLGVLLKAHKRLVGNGNGLKLVSVTNHIADIFKYSGFDKLFDIETG